MLETRHFPHTCFLSHVLFPFFFHFSSLPFKQATVSGKGPSARRQITRFSLNSYKRRRQSRRVANTAELWGGQALSCAFLAVASLDQLCTTDSEGRGRQTAAEDSTLHCHMSPLHSKCLNEEWQREKAGRQTQVREQSAGMNSDSLWCRSLDHHLMSGDKCCCCWCCCCCRVDGSRRRCTPSVNAHKDSQCFLPIHFETSLQTRFKQKPLLQCTPSSLHLRSADLISPLLKQPVSVQRYYKMASCPNSDGIVDSNV